MVKKSDFKPSQDWIKALPADRLEEVEAGARRILADMHLGGLRKAMKLSQAAVASKSGLAQTEISRIERSPETTQLRTLNRYVDGLGGVFKLVAEFPDGTQAEIPMHNGRLVKSRMTVRVDETTEEADNPSKARLAG